MVWLFFLKILFKMKYPFKFKSWSSFFTYNNICFIYKCLFPIGKHIYRETLKSDPLLQSLDINYPSLYNPFPLPLPSLSPSLPSPPLPFFPFPDYCFTLVHAISQGPLFLEFDSKMILGDQLINLRTILKIKGFIV